MSKMHHRTLARLIDRRFRQKGFIQGALLIGLALLALIVGAFAVANKGASTKTDMETARVMGSSVVKRGNDLRDAALRVVMAQGRDLAKMELVTGVVPVVTLTGGSWDLFDINLGVASEMRIPAKAMASSSADVAMTYDTALSVGGVSRRAFKLEGVSLATCQAINNQVYNDPIDNTPGAPATFTDGKEEGCFASGTPAVYTYFKVVS